MQQQNLKILVLAKQVPDTRNVGKDAMTPEGTVNRAALPAIFNPEDFNALEAALRLKDRVEGSTVHILTMGPQRAAAKEYLQIVEWAAADVDPDPGQLGLAGSPTKVKKIENVVFAAKEAKKLTAADEDINSLMVELIASHTLG